MPHDGKCVLRETASKGHLIVGVPGTANGSAKVLWETAATEPRGFRVQQLVSKQYAVYWIVWLLLCGCFAIRQTTKLLDAAGRQHSLLAPPNHGGTSSMATSATQALQHLQAHQQQQQQQKLSAGSSIGGGGAGGSGASAGNMTSNFINGSAAAVLADQHSKWPDGYVAICAVIKDQWLDLRYWIEYHRWLGVSKFYIYDNNSTLPAMLMLWDYLQQGIVEYEYFLGRPRRRRDFVDTNQYRAYQGCLLQHFRQHRWIAFIDADEFFVLPQHSNSNSTRTGMDSSDSTDRSSANGTPLDSRQRPLPTAPDQPTDPHKLQVAQEHQQIGQDNVISRSGTAAAQGGLHADTLGQPPLNATAEDGAVDNLAVFLSQYEGQAAIGVNWVLFGSSGHLTRPAEGPLAAFTACVPRTHWESTHVKVIANTNGILGLGHSPHEVVPRPGRSVVDVDQQPFKGPKTPQAKWHKLVLHHYVLKSKAEFVTKKARGSGAGNTKDWAYWQYVEQLANDTCTTAIPISKAFMSSKPRLALPESAHVLHGCHKKAAAAYQALLHSQTDGDGQQQSTGQGNPAEGGDADADSTSELLPC